MSEFFYILNFESKIFWPVWSKYVRIFILISVLSSVLININL